MKKQAVVALTISVLLLVLFVVAVGWEDVLSALGRADLSLYGLAFAATTVCLACRSLVWHRLLSIVDQPRPYWLVGSLFLTAMFAKYVTPYGQVTSGIGVAALISRYYESAYEEALAAVISADVLNYIPYYTLGSIGLAYVVFVYSPPIDFGQYAPLVLALLVAVALVIGIVWRRDGLVLDVVLRIAAGLRVVVDRVAPEKSDHLSRENVTRRFEGFYTTLDIVSRDRRSMAIALVYAHLGWLAFVAVLYLSAAAIDAPVPVGVAIAAVALSKLGFVVPTPGGVGGVELALAGVLYVIAPMSGAVALAVAILYRFATYWFTVLLGGIASIALTLKDPLPPDTH